MDLACIEKTETNYIQLGQEEIEHLQARDLFSHKGSHGRILLVAGSRGMTGAAILAARASLISGAGLVTVYTPGFCEPIVQAQIPEAITVGDKCSDRISEMPPITQFNAIGIGPGLGKNKETTKVVTKLVSHQTAMVIDADALNAIAPLPSEIHWEEKGFGHKILTPHQGEFDRLFGKHNNRWERILTARKFCEITGATLVLKGRYSAIVTSSGDVFFNPTGCPAMAKAGSGDVLTGMITAFLGKGLEPVAASKLATYLHGLAGEIAVKKLYEESVLASDIINNIPHAFRQIQE